MFVLSLAKYNLLLGGILGILEDFILIHGIRREDTFKTKRKTFLNMMLFKLEEFRLFVYGTSFVLDRNLF